MYVKWARRPRPVCSILSNPHNLIRMIKSVPNISAEAASPPPPVLLLARACIATSHGPFATAAGGAKGHCCHGPLLRLRAASAGACGGAVWIDRYGDR